MFDGEGTLDRANRTALSTSLDFMLPSRFISGMIAGKRQLPLPTTIGLLFGGLWGMLGALATPEHWRLLLIIVVCLITVILIMSLWFRQSTATSDSRGLFAHKAYIIAVSAEIAAIYAASAILPQVGLQGFFIQVVGFIVGLHFIGLWIATNSRHFVGIAFGMCLVSLAAMMFPQNWGPFLARDAVTGFGNALVLWIGASSPLLSRFRGALRR